MFKKSAFQSLKIQLSSYFTSEISLPLQFLLSHFGPYTHEIRIPSLKVGGLPSPNKNATTLTMAPCKSHVASFCFESYPLGPLFSNQINTLPRFPLGDLDIFGTSLHLDDVQKTTNYFWAVPDISSCKLT